MHDQPQWCEDEYDYIVVGSGAGGGPVAANLARAGYRVALLEAGGAHSPPSYDVPAFYTMACEDPEFRWDYIVRHYDSSVQQQRDTKCICDERQLGLWYPRAGTLGGCTAHHALITVRPHDADWDKLAELTGDESWRACEMRRYFERIERCTYLKKPKTGRKSPGGHGHTGWLSTSIAAPKLLVCDLQVVRIVWAALKAAVHGKFWRSVRYLLQRLRQHSGPWREFPISFLDPNDDRHPSFEREGIFYVPFSTEAGRRVGVRDLLNLTLQDHPNELTIRTHTLVTRILFEGNRAIGVEFVDGRRLYRADPRAVQTPMPASRALRARREVILSAGAFNSPQLLMLSGIGPPGDLEPLGIHPWLERCGVGKNLQDRYELGVVSRTKRDFAIIRGAKFRRPGRGEDPDPHFARWLKQAGPYTTNGAIVCLTKRSGATPEPDLFIFAVPGDFHGYYRERTHAIASTSARFSWVILKSHTSNNAGSVTLASKDPRDPPEINFRYFHEGSAGWESDLDGVVGAVELVRRMNRGLASVIAEETVPGAAVTGAKLRQFVRDEAWGHHASCTNRMGKEIDRLAVVDSRFRVIGTSGLRIVDASVFPNIPGFFIVTAIYMIAEKASDLIIAEARRRDGDRALSAGVSEKAAAVA